MNFNFSWNIPSHFTCFYTFSHSFLQSFLFFTLSLYSSRPQIFDFSISSLAFFLISFSALYNFSSVSLFAYTLIPPYSSLPCISYYSYVKNSQFLFICARTGDKHYLHCMYPWTNCYLIKSYFWIPTQFLIYTQHVTKCLIGIPPRLYAVLIFEQPISIFGCEPLASNI